MGKVVAGALQPVVERLNREFNAQIKRPEVRSQFEQNAFAGEGIEVNGEGGDERFAFARLHLGHAARVQHHAADELHVEVPHAQRAPRGLAARGERLGKDRVERLVVGLGQLLLGAVLALIAHRLLNALAELGAAAIEPLLKQHAEAGPESQSQIEFLLAGLRVKDDRIGELLKKRLESDPTEGAINMSLYGDNAMLPVLEAKLAAELSEHEKHEIQFAIDQLSAETIADEPEPFDIMSLYPETAPPV